MKAQWTLGIATVAAVLNWVAGFGWSALNGDQAALWIVAINAVALVVAALKTRPIAPQVWTYAITSAAALLGAYGLHLSQNFTSGLSLVILSILALLTHGQVSPASEVKASDAS
jgi:uncharacterized membrane protein